MNALFAIFVALCVVPTVVLSETAAQRARAASPIKHVVVVMLENRAFDHMCGWLRQWNVPVDGLNGSQFNIANGTKYLVRDDCPYVNPFDPLHDLQDTTSEIMGYGKTYVKPEPMDGFAETHMRHGFKDYWAVMHGFAPHRVPAISTIAKEFAVFDRYYASLPGPTYPNRMFFHSGTSHGHVTDDLFTTILPGVPQRTLYNVLGDNNISWGVYYSDVTDTILFDQLRDWKNLQHNKGIDDLKKDAVNGNLPAFSWVTPRFFGLFGPPQDQHPDHDVVLGEEFVAEVYSAVRNAPTWNETLFIVTYDEHGGLYDHVPPPMDNVPNPDGINNADTGFNFTRLGLRVCTVMASPRIPKGTVVHEPAEAPHQRFEHGSVYATLRQLWNISEELTARTAFAAPFDHIVSLAEPRTDCPTSLPTPAMTEAERAALWRATNAKTPNGLQKHFHLMLEKALGVTPEKMTGGKHHSTQASISHAVHEMMEQVMAEAKAKASQP